MFDINMHRVPPPYAVDSWRHNVFNSYKRQNNRLHVARLLRVDSENMLCDIELLDIPVRYGEVLLPLQGSLTHYDGSTPIPGDLVIIGFDNNSFLYILTVIPSAPKYSLNYDKLQLFNNKIVRLRRPSLIYPGDYYRLSERNSLLENTERFLLEDSNFTGYYSQPDLMISLFSANINVQEIGNYFSYFGHPLMVSNIDSEDFLITKDGQKFLIPTEKDNETSYEEGGLSYFIGRILFPNYFNDVSYNPLKDGFLQDFYKEFDLEKHLFLFDIGTVLSLEGQPIEHKILNVEDDSLIEVDEENSFTDDKDKEEKQASMLRFLTSMGLKLVLNKEGFLQLVLPSTSSESSFGEGLSSIIKLLGSLRLHLGKEISPVEDMSLSLKTDGSITLTIGKGLTGISLESIFEGGVTLEIGEDDEGLSLLLEASGDINLKFKSLQIDCESLSVHASDSVSIQTSMFTYNGAEVETK